jgi:hypothetical protein
MKSRLVQFSAVVVGQSHNPSILNPDWVEGQGIVPKSWGWPVKENITTPPLSLVRYENGVVITVEQEKLQVTDPNVEEGPENSKVTQIASGYLNTLPHVTYKAVGVNFQGLIPMQTPEVYIRDRFLKPGPWTEVSPDLDAVGIRLLFPLEDGGRFTLTLDVGAANLPDNADAQPVVVTNANFNRTCSSSPTLNDAKEHLGKAMGDWANYHEKLHQFFELEDNNG